MMAAQLQEQASGAAQSPVAGGGSASLQTQEHNSNARASDPSSQTWPPLQNRAGESLSPFVRALADSLVNWQPLDDKTVRRATEENKLIFMHIGFSASHHCHLMRQDSFSHPSVASILNESFIPIAIDREERPDIDAIYWNYNVMMNTGGGWPINVVTLPRLGPLFGGTYWPAPGHAEFPSREQADDLTLDMMLQKVHQAWVEKEDTCIAEVETNLAKLRQVVAEGTLINSGLGSTVTGTLPNGTGQEAPGPTLDLDLDQLDEAYEQIQRVWDAQHAGFGAGAKFIMVPRIAFLLRLAHFPQEVQDVLGERVVAAGTQMALATLRKIRDGGLHDCVGGGFARYSVTPDWTLPQFEKMVVDNALLLGLYLDAMLSSSSTLSGGGTPEFLDVVLELADYLTSPPIRREDGSFATSEAADSFYKRGDQHMRQGAYYVWTRREFDSVVRGSGSGGQREAEVAVAMAYWDVLDHGNVDSQDDPADEFISQNILHVVKSKSELRMMFGIDSDDEVERILAEAKEKLRAHREKERVRPPTDEKAVTYINGVVISALARTGATLKYGHVDVARGERCIAAARKAADFVKEKLWDPKEERLYRFYHVDARGPTKAFDEDYAFIIQGLLDLYEVTGDDSLLSWAGQLQEIQLKLFYDFPVPAASSTPAPPLTSQSRSGAFYNTPLNAPHGIQDPHSTHFRVKDGIDGTQPAANGVSVSNLFRLAHTREELSRYAHLARETMHGFEIEIMQHPSLFTTLLAGVVTARLEDKFERVEIAAAEVVDGPGGEEDARRRAAFFLRPRAECRCLVYRSEPS